METTNDAMFTALSGSYPSAGQTLGDLLYAFWSEKGLQYRGTLERDWYISEGAVGFTLGDLANDYFANLYDLVIFNYSDSDEWLELQVFSRVDTVEQDIFIG